MLFTKFQHSAFFAAGQQYRSIPENMNLNYVGQRYGFLNLVLSQRMVSGSWEHRAEGRTGEVQEEVTPPTMWSGVISPGKCLKFCVQNPAFWCILG